MSELASGAAARSVLYAKGATEGQAMGFLQPIVIDTHPLNNPWINYSVYLNNTFAPGVLMLLIFMVTVFSIGVEIKDRTARDWLRQGNNSIWISLAGKLLPHTAIFFLMGILYNVYLYGYLHFPCNSGHPAHAAGHPLPGTGFAGHGHPDDRHTAHAAPGTEFCLSCGACCRSPCAGCRFCHGHAPRVAGLPTSSRCSHYFLIYVDQALNGYPMIYSWTNYVALLVFMLLPFLVAGRLKEALVYYKYIP